MKPAGGYDAAVASSFLAAVFLVALGCGVTHYATGTLLEGSIILSGAFWLLASVLPLFIEDADMITGLANGVAAATAVYAGLSALPST